MPSFDYRREIDGLRSVAVVPVILFHGGFSVFSGGYVGVDVFFVISGYLITAIIVRDFEAGRFSVLDFYERRVRRILPALFFVVVLCIPVAWKWLFPHELIQFGRSVVAVVLFVSNILFWRETAYFASAAEEKPLLHTWSLAVEEQFYVLFPLLIAISWRWGVARVVFLVGMLAIASVCLAEWASISKPSANFYLLPTRAWEFFVGSLLAFYLVHRSLPPHGLAEVGSVVGLALIIFAILAFDESTRFPGFAALVPVLGTVLVILCAHSQTLVGRILGLPPLVGVGLISYSAYLWHQPLFAFARIRSIDHPSALVMGGLALATLFLAWLSWRFVEQPFRNRTHFQRKTIFAGAAIASIGLSIGGGALHAFDGVPSRFDGNALRLNDFSTDYERNPKNCLPVSGGPVGEVCIFNPDYLQRVVLWGDSHAMTISVKLAEALDRHKIGLVKVTSEGCIPAVGLTRTGDPACSSHNAAVLAQIGQAWESEIVVLAGRWALSIEGTRFDNLEGGVEPGGKFELRPLSGESLDQDEVVARSYRRTVERLLEANKVVVVVGNVPEVGWDVPRRLAKAHAFGIKIDRPVSTSAAVFEERNRSTEAVFSAFSSHDRFLLVEPSNLFCNSVLEDRCVAEIDGDPLYWDDDHVNSVGASMIADAVVGRLANFLVPSGEVHHRGSAARGKEGVE